MANSSQRHNHQMAHLALQQDLMHQNMHQIIAQLNTVLFNVSDKSRGISSCGGCGQACGHSCRQGCGPPMSTTLGFQPGGGNPKLADFPQCHLQADVPLVSFPLVPRLDFQVDIQAATWFQHTMPHRLCPMVMAMLPLGNTPSQAAPMPTCINSQFQMSWNGFQIRTSAIPADLTLLTAIWNMFCHMHLRKSSHDVNFTHQNAQQYINLGHPCSTRNRHKTWLPNMWQVGVENLVVASDDSNIFYVNAPSLPDPTQHLRLYRRDNGNITVVASNTGSSRRLYKHRAPQQLISAPAYAGKLLNSKQKTTLQTLAPFKYLSWKALLSLINDALCAPCRSCLQMVDKWCQPICAMGTLIVSLLHLRAT